MTETAPAQWRNRIVRSGTASPKELQAHPENWRIHPATQQQEMKNILNAIGWVRPVIVNERTGTIVNGHMRVALALKNGEQEIPVDYVDLSDDEEAAVLATFDPISDLARSDHGKLRQLIQYSQDQGIDMEAISRALLQKDQGDGDVIDQESSGFDQSQTHAGVRERFEQTPWRQIHLLMTNTEYNQIIRQFREIAMQHGLKTNLDVFMWLVWQHEKAMRTAKA